MLTSALSTFLSQMLNWARTAVMKRHLRLVSSAKEAERLTQEELSNAHHSLAKFQAQAGDRALHVRSNYGHCKV
jgi:vacuolar-type H+-ATPase subunit D/Vma8